MIETITLKVENFLSVLSISESSPKYLLDILQQVAYFL